MSTDVHQGLSLSESAALLKQYGPNELPVKKKSLLLLFLSQFNDVMVYILFVALGISLVLPFIEYAGHPHADSFLDAIVIAAILILNAILGFVQEYKAEEAIHMLQKLSSPHTRVRREGREIIIPSEELVPGDIVILEAGDKISADCKIITASHLAVNESSLTGESAAISKTEEDMVFSGTLVTRGYAECIVTATGLQTEIGRIAQLVSETELPVTPLQKRMAALGKTIGAVVVLFCAVIFFIGEFEHMQLGEILLVAVSLAVSAVPEGLPAVVTVCMAMGVRRMTKQHALVRRLEALETLGSVSVICADKTGTITENKMQVVDSWVNDNSYDATYLGQIAASCNRAQLPNVGDPTEVGLLEFAESVGAKRLPIDEEEVPFSSEGKYMQTRHGDKVFLKGAPEVIFDMAVDETEEILQKNEELAMHGLRVLACAEKRGKTIHFVGLIAMEDPPRKTAKEAIAQAKSAGIRTIMITGDNPKTAESIAKKVGIKGDVLLGTDLNTMSVAQLKVSLKTVSIFARVSPEHKLKILAALQEQGDIVAMSGDGVNDAPALKGAHVGIAMGNVGTEVAREASSIVLVDDHFSTIVTAIKEGRRIYDNIRKFVLFLLRANFDELLFIGTVILLKLPLPYLPVHILWINLMTDGLPALALGMEPAERDIMRKPPRNPGEHLLAGQSGKLTFAAVFAFGIAFVFFLWQLSIGIMLDEARTTTLTLAILFELFLAHSVRSEKPIWTIGFFSNPWIIWGTAIPFALQLILLFSPLRTYFHLTTLTPMEWLEIFFLAFGSFLVFELLKLLPNGKRELLN
ncbi:HAD-IC family P-type ATPase [Candidatus Peribacteria bacterium]|nr:HAD-IC family P-type ATPase [Candidatus Peribacteria bacterium]